MLNKRFNITIKIVAWGLGILLVIGFVIVPLALKWGIESQGSKVLKHSVQVRAVHVNPFMLSLDVNGLRILASDKTPLIAVDKVAVDASFLALLKKIYRVESLLIDGLRIDARLLSGGKINLLELIPAPSTTAAAPQAAPAGPAPVIMADLVELKHGQVIFTDETIEPRFTTTIGDIDVSLTGFSTDPASSTKIIAACKVDTKGAVSVEALVKPLAKPLELETAVTVGSYVLTVLSPYVGKYTGRALADGGFDLRMDYRIADNKLTASHKVLIQNFTFGDKVESKDALGLPFGLALALLEDANGQIKISLPVTGDMSSPEFRYWPLVGQVVRNFFFKVVTKPFAFLGSMLGDESGTDELGYVKFAPGSAELTDTEKEKLALLVKGLKERPKLELEINGSYDPAMDWKAIQADVLAREYEALRREATGDEMKIYGQIYQRSFGIRDLWALNKKYKSKDGSYDAPRVIEEIKKQLIEKAPADKAAMNILAAARAQKIHDEIVALGLDAQKAVMGAAHEVQGSMGHVPLEFTLTVFGEGVK